MTRTDAEDLRQADAADEPGAAARQQPARPEPGDPRREKPVELAAKVDRRRARPSLVPAELPAPVYDVTVQAELLAADKKTVLATAYTPVRRMPVRLPLVVQLDGAARIEATLDAKTGATVKLKGKVERRDGFEGRRGARR